MYCFTQKQVPKFTHVLSKGKDVKEVTLKSGNQLWGVKLYISDSYHRFSSGWSLFAKETNLEAGDICILDLIDPDLPLFEAHITKASSI